MPMSKPKYASGDRVCWQWGREKNFGVVTERYFCSAGGDRQQRHRNQPESRDEVIYLIEQVSGGRVLKFDSELLHEH